MTSLKTRTRKCGNPKCSYVGMISKGSVNAIEKKMDYHSRTRCGKGKYKVTENA